MRWGPKQIPPESAPGIISGNQTAPLHVLPKRRVGSIGSGGTVGETATGACQTAELPARDPRVEALL
jgi:hypothetical protein